MKKLFFLTAAIVLTTWLGGMNTMYCSGYSNGAKTESAFSNAPFGKVLVNEISTTQMDFKCVDHKWEYLSVQCTTIHGRPAYCFKLIVYKAKECEDFKLSINESMTPGYPAWNYDNQGNLIIKGCFWANNANNPLCVKIDFSNPHCCDIVACTKLPCCYKKEWKGKVRCELIDGQLAYCYSITIYDVKECGKFHFTTNGVEVSPPTIVYDLNGNATVTGCVWAYTYPSVGGEFCFKVDFKDPHCCDFKGCLKLPCCEQKWKGEVICDYIDGQKVYCYKVVVAGAKACDGLKFSVQGTSVTGPIIVYDANGNATITGCVLASSIPPLYDKLCFKVDFKNPKCCDFKGCMILPTDCCKKKDYGFETYECHVVDGQKVICFVFVVKDAKECEQFNYAVNATTVEGPSYSYDANGNLFIKHCVTNVEGTQLCIKIDWISDLCCDIGVCKDLPPCSIISPQNTSRSSEDIKSSSNELMEINPVPADDYIKVKLKSEAIPSVIIIRDMNQKQVFKTIPLTNEATIYTGGMPSGMYLISLYNLEGKRLAVKKVQLVHR